MTPAEPAELLALARAMAVEAGDLLLEHRRGAVAFTTKSTPTDVVTEADTAAERLLVQRISAARPDDGLLGEEGAAREGTSGLRWVLDPLDGTVNYLYDLPGWSVSVAVEDTDGALVAVVHAPTVGSDVLGGPRRWRVPQRRADPPVGVHDAGPGAARHRVQL